MARIAELVYVKMNVMFADQDTLEMNERVWDELENVLGISKQETITPDKADRIGDYLVNNNTATRLVGIEYSDKEGVLHSLVWEQFYERYSAAWIYNAIAKIPADTRLQLFFSDKPLDKDDE